MERAAKRLMTGSVEFQRGQFLRIQDCLKRKDFPGHVDPFLVGLGAMEPLLMDASGKPIEYIKSEDGSVLAKPLTCKSDGKKRGSNGRRC